MRIIAGKKRGMKLLPPKGMRTRPIIDRVKESLFSVLYKYDILDGALTADLFSGTGSMGLECLSRGAKFAVFVEKDPKTVDILNKNIEKAAFVAESKVIRTNAFKIGAPVAHGQEKFDLVFVDPPYAMARDTSIDSRLGKLLILLSEQVKTDGIVVVRADSETHLLDEYEKLSIIDRRKWGSMAVTLLRLSEESEEAVSDDIEE